MKQKRFSGFAKTNSNGTKSDKGKIANIRHLTRIITYLSEVKYDYAKSIERKTGIGYPHIKSALMFLLNYKIIRVFKIDKAGINPESKFYKLNPKYKNMKQLKQLNLIERGK